MRHLRSEFVDPLEARVSDLKSAIKKLSESKRILMDNYTNRHNNKNIAREALAKIGFSIKSKPLIFKVSLHGSLQTSPGLCSNFN